MLLTRANSFSKLKTAQRRGLKRAIVATARKLAVILRRMWMDGEAFRFTDGAAGA